MFHWEATTHRICSGKKVFLKLGQILEKYVGKNSFFNKVAN